MGVDVRRVAACVEVYVCWNVLLFALLFAQLVEMCEVNSTLLVCVDWL